jgi:hypothetical protein
MAGNAKFSGKLTPVSASRTRARFTVNDVQAVT